MELLENGSFEVPVNTSAVQQHPDGTVPGWSSHSGGLEFWRGTVGGVTPEVGEQVTEVDNSIRAIWQDVIVPAAAGEYRWRFQHHHRPSTGEFANTVELRIGDSSNPILANPVIFTSETNQGDPWMLREGVWSKPAGLTTVRFLIHRVSPAFGSAGNIIDDASLVLVPERGCCRPIEGMEQCYTRSDDSTGRAVPLLCCDSTIEWRDTLDGHLLTGEELDTLEPCTPTATPPPEPDEQVIDELNFTEPPTPEVEAAFEAARAFWNGVLTELLPPTPHAGDPAYDQILIDVMVEPIDGPGGTLGSAGPTILRPGSLLTLQGRMRFDEDDMQAMADSGELAAVVRHEMGHVLQLGAGPLWNQFATDFGTADAGWTGPQAVAEYDAMPGAPGGRDRVPVEFNTGNPGSDNGHWDSGAGHNDPARCFDNELMSFALSGSAAVSRVTLAALDDMGYPAVDRSAGDGYVCGQP